MKIKSLILAMAACAGLFSACSNDLIDESTTDSKQDLEKNAYASFDLVMPNAGANTRTNPNGGDAGDGKVDGTSAENQFGTAQIILFTTDDNKLAQVEVLNRVADFSPTIVGGATHYTTKKDIKVAAASYYVYVILNPATELKLEVGATTLKEFQAMVEQVAPQTGKYCTDNQFMMTNADVITATVVEKTNIEGNAKSVIVNVERLAAKVTFSSKNDKNTYNINDTENNVAGTVTFDAYKIINTRNSAFNLRRVGTSLEDATIGEKETGSNYVIENKWDIKSSWNIDNFNANYSRKYNTYVAFRKLNEKADLQTLAYCLENTMLQKDQMNGYSTGVILRAKIALNAASVTGGVTESGDLYKYEGKYYASLVDLAKAYDEKWEGTSNTEGLSKDILNILGKDTDQSIEDYLKSINNPTTLHNDFSIDYYVGGMCYYTYWLRHANNNDDSMGIMEFAIVRNNVYRLTINSVKGIGNFTSGTPGEDPKNPGEPDVDPENPNPEIPGEIVPDPEPTDPVVPVDPENPDESTDTYLNVSIDILKWTVRNNDIDL